MRLLHSRSVMFIETLRPSTSGKRFLHTTCAALDAWNASVFQIQAQLNTFLQGSAFATGSSLLPQRVQFLNQQSQLVHATCALLCSLGELGAPGSTPTSSTSGTLTLQQAVACSSLAFPFQLMTASYNDLKLPAFALAGSDGGSLGLACIPLIQQRFRQGPQGRVKSTAAAPVCDVFLESATQRLAALNISNQLACFRFASDGESTGFTPAVASDLGSNAHPAIIAGPPMLACIVLQENLDRFIAPLQAGFTSALQASQIRKKQRATSDKQEEDSPFTLFC